MPRTWHAGNLLPMRIIAGIHRGRRLLGPKDADTTRPITDRVKQSLFDRLVSHGLIEDAVVIDLFCGTGSLGLEALSRGASQCLFVDNHRDAIKRLEQNLAALELTSLATVRQADVLTGLWLNHLPVDRAMTLIFFDPPYQMMEKEASFAAIAKLMTKLLPRMEQDGALCLRTSRQGHVGPVPGWLGPGSHRHGTMMMHYYQPDTAAGQPTTAETAT